MKRVLVSAVALAAAALVLGQTPRAPAQEIPTAGLSCGSADQAARRALRDAETAYERDRLHNGGSTREYGGLIYRTPEGGYGFTAPAPGTTDSYDPNDLLGPDRPDGYDDPNYVPHLRTGEVVVGGYHIHPSDGDYDNNSLSGPDERWGDYFNVPSYLRTPHEDYVEHDPDTPPGASSDIDPSDGADCDESDDTLGDNDRPWYAFFYGDPHLTSHDSLGFDFQAAGEFIAVQSPENDLTIQARMEPLAGHPTVSGVTAVAVKVSTGRRVGIYLAAPHVRVDGQAVVAAHTDLGARASLDLSADHADIVTPQGDRIRVYFADPTFLDAYVALAPQRRGKVSGILGNFDGDQQNEFMTRGNIGVDVLAAGAEDYRQRLYHDWGDSWRIDASESLFDYAPGKTTASYDLRDYPAQLPDRRAIMASSAAVSAAQQCRAAGLSSGRLFENCVFDIAVTGDARAAQNYLTAQALLAQGYLGPPPLGTFNLASIAPNALLTLSGDAMIANGVARLTPAVGGKSGALFTAVPAPVQNGFVTEFSMAFSNEGGTGDSDGHTGGDGVAFLISGSPLTQAGEGGLALGYGDLENVLVVELDTWRNVYDPSGNHVSVHWAKPNVAINDDSQTSLASSSAIPNLSDGRPHHVRVDYTPGRLRVFVDDMARPAIDTPLQLAQRVRLRRGMAWLGFTGGTAMAYQNQDISSWRFTPSSSAH